MPVLLPPLRSLLFLPATSTQLLAKATERGADALIVDLEDSVQGDRKAEARRMAADAVASLHARGATVLVRVNALEPDTAADIQALPLEKVAALMLPKVDALADLERVDALLKTAHPGGRPIAALIESPRGILECTRIASHPSLCALVFGPEDYSSALGVAPTLPALGWPAQMLVTTAHAFGLQAWGLPGGLAEIHDETAFAGSVDAARTMGFTGTVCIHPRQVPIINRGFSASQAERDWALQVVQADEAAAREGRGAVMLDGRMIDRPVVERARRVLAMRGG
jgi:citrate lyase subunit beta/citryl-CoA lyase